MRRSWLPLLILAAGALGCTRAGDDAARAEVLATVQGDPDRGRVALASYGCGSCHVIPGVRQARGKVGPPLTDFAQRSYIAGSIFNTPNHLAAWIRRPDSVEPGTVMPTLGVGEQQARDMAAYLYLETGTGAFGPPRLLPASLIQGD